ncbi:MAG: CRTAC1 family protein [Bacteroidota bacterium]|nr:CRTAC1 family protein [Bacteroidota bacterium]
MTLRPALLLVVLVGVCGCGHEPAPERSVALTDVTREAGIGGFKHDNGEVGDKYYAEQMGSGAGFLDYDGDGWQDIVLMGGGQWQRSPYGWYKPLWLYRNRGDGTFTDVTEAAGITGIEAYTIGIAAADYDNDGDADFLLTNLGRNMLFRNEEGVFTEVGREAGVSAHDEWSSSALWIDGNNDGWLDVFVGNYADWSPATDKFCPEGGTVKLYCVPADYEGISSRYFVNQGDGTFVEETQEAGLVHTLGKALGAAEWDFNLDGWSDFVVANDGEGDLLYENQGGTFMERGVPSGIAFSEHGEARAGMGIDIGVTDSTGEPSIFVGNFSEEMIGVYRYLGHGLFADRAALSRIGQPSLNTLTFGLFLIDIELDGDLDLFVANGHVYPDRLVGQDKITYRQRAQLFINNGEGTFTETDPSEAVPLSMYLVARGAAYADYDRDGDQDILVVENHGAAHLWRNDTVGHNWLRITVAGTTGNRDGLGARILVYTDDHRQERRIRSGSSYLSQSEFAAVFGLGSYEAADSVKVYWPTGRLDVLHSVAANQALHLAAGTWKTVDMPGVN